MLDSEADADTPAPTAKRAARSAPITAFTPARSLFSVCTRTLLFPVFEAFDRSLPVADDAYSAKRVPQVGIGNLS
jgi:hypothetical protein